MLELMLVRALVLSFSMSSSFEPLLVKERARRLTNDDARASRGAGSAGIASWVLDGAATRLPFAVGADAPMTKFCADIALLVTDHRGVFITIRRRARRGRRRQ